MHRKHLVSCLSPYITRILLAAGSTEQGHALLQARDRQRLEGKRDRALLALLLAGGLRRHEAVALTLDHLQRREEHWAIVDLVGKAGQVRIRISLPSGKTPIRYSHPEAGQGRVREAAVNHSRKRRFLPCPISGSNDATQKKPESTKEQ